MKRITILIMCLGSTLGLTLLAIALTEPRRSAADQPVTRPTQERYVGPLYGEEGLKAIPPGSRPIPLARDITIHLPAVSHGAGLAGAGFIVVAADAEITTRTLGLDAVWSVSITNLDTHETIFDQDDLNRPIRLAPGQQARPTLTEVVAAPPGAYRVLIGLRESDRLVVSRSHLAFLDSD